MSEGIERAARAIAVSLEVSPESWRDHVDQARAVLTAIRDPWDGVVYAGIRKGVDIGFGVGYDDYVEIFRAMIDEALR